MQEGVSAANGSCEQGHDGNEVGGLDPGLSTTGHGVKKGGIKMKSNGWPSARQHLPVKDETSRLPRHGGASPKSPFDSQGILKHINAS